MQQAAITPDLPAIKGEHQLLYTYSQVDNVSDQIAFQLSAMMAAKDDVTLLETNGSFNSVPVICICIERCAELLILILASWKAGFAVVLVDPKNPRKRISLVIKTSLSQLVIVGDDNTLDLPTTRISLQKFDFTARQHTSGKSRRNPDHIDLLQDHDNLALVRFTSGSTGSPKGILEAHSSLAPFNTSWGSRCKRNSLLFLSPIFTFAESAIWPYLISGGCVTTVSSTSLENLAACINDYEITDLFITPSALQIIEPRDVPGLKCIAVAGEPIPSQLLSTWAPHVEFVSTFGASEVGSVAFPSYHDM